MRRLTYTNPTLLSIAILLIRLTLGSILFVSGAGKVFGWFGGKGLAATVESFGIKLGIAAPLAYLSCFTECFGGLLLAVGFLLRPSALAITINMLVATIVTLPNGFFGPGAAAYPFSLMISALVLCLSGPMRYSVDGLLESPETHFGLDGMLRAQMGKRPVAS